MKKIIDFLEKLIGESYALRQLASKEYRRSPDDVNFVQMRTRWLRSCEDVLTHAELDVYLKEFYGMMHRATIGQYEIGEVTGLLESARDALLQGFVGKIRYLLHAEMFDSVIDQAAELLKAGHKIPAGVLGRIVIERWLRDQAEKGNIAGWETDKPSSLNESLKKAGVFSVPKWRHVQSLLDVGNSAAHGKDSEFSEEDVKRMLAFAETNCV